MRGGTLFSGIGAPELAAPDINWRWCAETDPFAAAVLEHRFGTLNLSDVTKVNWDAVEPVDIVVAGPPCQDHSVAGLRRGLAGERGNLSIVYVDILDAIDPFWSVTENVPGWLSLADNAFGSFLGRLVGHDTALVPERGQRWTDAGVVDGPRRTAAWRTLDAQYFGVPQRRRRVFVVAVRGSGNGAAAEALLPFATRLQRHPPSGRQAREGVARPIASGANGGSFDSHLGGEVSCSLDGNYGKGPGGRGAAERTVVAAALRSNQWCDHVDDESRLIAYGGNNTAGAIDVATACNTHAGPHGRLDFHSETFVTHSLRADAFTNAVAFQANAGRDFTADLDCGIGGMSSAAIAFDFQNEAVQAIPGALQNQGHHGSSACGYGVCLGMTVRRLTPLECERLQGFPDGFTAIRYRGKPAADGPRYRILGNAMAVPVIRWILQRILKDTPA